MQVPLKRVIVLTAWEASKIPDNWADVLRDSAEVWVPCTHNAQVFGRSLGRPAFRLPHPFVPRILPEASSQVTTWLGLKPHDYVFYSIFTWQERKNPLGIIEAFLRAFPKEPDAVLILKTIWGIVSEPQALADLAAIVRRVTGRNEIAHPRVRILAGVWADDMLLALAKRGNCYVSLHRGEAWCYPLFDAACAGTPVIATDYSGPKDYLNPVDHQLVRCKIIPVTERGFNFRSDMFWAEPDLAHASTLMRRAYENRNGVLERAHAAAESLRRAYSLRAVGKAAVDRLRALKGEMP